MLIKLSWYKKEFGGIKPKEYLDILSLEGDSTDDIPGVRGIGKKKALDLIQNIGWKKLKANNFVTNYKTYDKTYDLKGNKKAIILSRKLARLQYLKDIKIKKHEYKKLYIINTFKYYGFKSLLNKDTIKAFKFMGGK